MEAWWGTDVARGGARARRNGVSNEERRPNAAEPILRPVAGVADVQVVGAIDEAILSECGLVTSARSVWLHQSTVRHIQDRRMAPRDVEFALQYMPAAILRPHFFGVDLREARGNRFHLVHLVRDFEGRPLYVALKLVSAVDASSETDELWVSTAYPIARNFLTQKRYQNTLSAYRIEEP